MIDCELDQSVWAIVTADSVICLSKTYAQCVIIIEQQNLDKNVATIVTNNAVAEMVNRKLDRLRES